MLLDLLIITGGVGAILLLAEMVIRASNRIIQHYGISGGFVGLTVLSIGTSLLEIFTHVVGSIRILREPELYGSLSALLLGSNIGSDVFQQNFLLPLVALFAAVTIPRGRVFSEVGALIAASLLLWLFCLDGRLTRGEGAMLVLLYAAYLYYLARVEKQGTGRVARRLLNSRQLLASQLVIIVGCAVIALLAEPVLAAATRLVNQLPVSASFFGVAVLGVAAATPELSTSLAAVRRGQSDIAAGVLIGSNVTNPLFSAGVGAVISSYSVPPVVVLLDLPMKIATGALIYWVFWQQERMPRLVGWVLMLAYFSYLHLRLVLFPVDWTGL